MKRISRENVAKGIQGENNVNIVLSNFQYPSIYLHDLLIVFNNGTSTQIDNILISPAGIFVIEMKNYSGAIVGGYNAQYWHYALGKSRFKFYNPIRQNETHIRAIKNILISKGIVSHPIHSLIVFGNDATLNFKDCKDNVIQLKDLERFIREKNERSPVLTSEDITAIFVGLAEENKAFDRKAVEKHINYAKSRGKK